MCETERYFTYSERKELLEQQMYLCAGCGKNMWREGGVHAVQAHHIVPYRDGGSTDLSNGVALCKTCHKAFDRLSENGEIYPGGYHLKDADEGQIRNYTLFQRALGSQR